MNLKTPTQVNKFLADNQHKFDTPEAYYGDEPNAYRWTPEQWDAAQLRVAIMASFDYVQSVGNVTIPLLYQHANEYDSVNRIHERVYFPTSHKEVGLMEKHGIPMFGLETRHAIGEYDVLAMSLNYMPYWVNQIKMLRMSGIPVRWSERTHKHPLIILGGHAFANPSLVSPTVDLVWCGEAEDETKEQQARASWIQDSKAPRETRRAPQDNPGWNMVMGDIIKLKEAGAFDTDTDKDDALEALVKRYPFLWCPKFVKYSHKKVKGNWRVTGWEMTRDVPKVAVKRIVRNLTEATSTTNPPVIFHDPRMGMGTIQAARGCTYHCGFCAATFREAPYRERSEDKTIADFKLAQRNTGCVDVSPLMLEFGTYSRKKSLMKRILEEVTPELSMPSLRIDTFGSDPVFGQVAVHGQKKTATIAAEGSSQKLREIVTKGIDEDDILKSVSNALAAGYRSLKIYMVASLPGETDEDYKEMLETAKKIDALRKSVDSNIKVRFSWKPLMVQGGTPLQWTECRRMDGNLSDTMAEIQALGFGTQMGDETKSGLGNYVQMAEMCDDVAAEAMLDAVLEANIGTYGAMSKRIGEIIERHLAAYDRTYRDYYRPKDEDEVFAWDVIDPLITKAYLLRHWRQIQKRVRDEPVGKESDGTPIPIYGKGFIEKFGACTIGCTECGACDKDHLAMMGELALREDEPVRLQDIKTIDHRSVNTRVTLVCSVDPYRRYVDTKHWTLAIRRAAFQADLTPAIDSQFYITDKIKSNLTGFAGLQLVEFGFVDHLDINDLPGLLNPRLEPHGLKIESVTTFPKPLKRYGAGMWWQLEVDQPESVMREAIKKINAKDYHPMIVRTTEYRTGPQKEEINIHDAVSDLWVSVSGTAVKLNMIARTRYSPYDVANAIIGKRSDVMRYPAVLNKVFSEVKATEDAFTIYCERCDKPVLTDIIGEAGDDICPKCATERTKDAVRVEV